MLLTVYANLVIRADLLPHREEIRFLVVGAFGRLKAVHVNVKDLKRVELESMPKSSMSWR